MSLAFSLSTAILAIINSSPTVLSGNILGISFTITQSQLVYFVIAAIVGVIAESIIGWRLPFGILGAFLASLLGIWLFTNVIPVEIGGTLTVAGEAIPVVKAFIGAILVVTIWHFLTFPSWRQHHRYYRGRRSEYSRERAPRRERGYRRRRRREY